MNSVLKFFQSNYEWLFSGVLSGLIFFLLGNKTGYNRAIKQHQKIGRDGKGIQVGGNYIVRGENNE